MRGKNKKTGNSPVTIFQNKNRKGLKPTIFLTENRRGSHVGMILSFVIFITFIVFLYSVLRPAIKAGEEKQTTLDSIQKKIEDNVSTVFTSTSIQINSTLNPPTNCVKLRDFLVFMSMDSLHIIVKNELDGLEEVSTGPRENESFGRDIIINRDDASKLFFRIYSFSKFDEIGDANPEPCSVITKGTYGISLTLRGRYMSEKSVYELIEYYKSDYEKLKNALKIPPGTEFGFGFTQSNGTKINVGNAPKSASVYAGETPVQYVDDRANILSGFINIKIW